MINQLVEFLRSVHMELIGNRIFNLFSVSKTNDGALLPENRYTLITGKLWINKSVTEASVLGRDLILAVVTDLSPCMRRFNALVALPHSTLMTDLLNPTRKETFDEPYSKDYSLVVSFVVSNSS